MQLPDYIKNKQRGSLVDRALANVGSPRPPHISIQNNRFTLIDAAGSKHQIQTLYLDAVIFDLLEHMSKLFYDPNKPWKEGASDSPLCWSDNGIGPSSQVSPPEDFETGPTCELCPQNRWGSAISKMTGKEIRACRDEQKVAVLVPGFEGIYLLVIPPNSLKKGDKSWAAYVAKFKGQDFDYTDVITRLTFKDGVQGTLEFAPSPNPWLTEDLVTLRDKAAAAKAADTVIGRLDKPRGAERSVGAHPALAAPYGISGPLAPAHSAIAATPLAATTPVSESITEPTKRKRRTKEEIAIDELKKAHPLAGAPFSVQAAAEPIRAPFREDPPRPPYATASPPTANGSFGIAQGATPGEQMAADIAKLFG